MIALIKNVLLTLSSRVGIIISALVISIFTARYLGPDGRGQYFYIYSLVTILAQFSMLGLQSSNTYFVASNPALKNKLTINSAWISLIICSAFALIVILALYWTTTNINHDCLWIIVILTPPYLFYLLGISLLAGIDKFSLLNYYQLLFNGLTVLAVLLAGYFSHELCIIFLLIAGAWLAVAILLFRSLYTKEEHSNIKFDYAMFKSGFVYSCKAYIITACTLVVLRTNVFLLKEFSSYTEVGYFSIAAQINDALALLPTTIALCLFPQLIKAKADDLLITIDVLKKLGCILLILILLIGYGASFFIKLLFGVKFVPAVEILRFMLPGSFFSGIILILSQYLAARDLPVSLLYIWLAAVFVNVLLSYFIIVKCGAIGAAIGMSISYGLILIACSILIIISMKDVSLVNQRVALQNSRS